MKYKIIRNKNYLHRKTEPVATLEEGEEIANKLLAVLAGLKFGMGLSAIQIGIPKSVSIVKARKDIPPMTLMNPVVVEASKEKIIFSEGCLSIPGKIVSTVRSIKVVVSCLNWANPLPFGPDVDPITPESSGTDYGLLESVCVQHEIDHCNGILMTDAGVRHIPSLKKVIKYGRNDKVVVEKNGETQYIKYKKALELVSDGWKII